MICRRPCLATVPVPVPIDRGARGTLLSHCALGHVWGTLGHRGTFGANGWISGRGDGHDTL